MKNPQTVTEIEVVLEDIRCMKQIENFPNLRSLTLIKTNIEQIEVTLLFLLINQKKGPWKMHPPGLTLAKSESTQGNQRPGSVQKAEIAIPY